MLNGQTPDIRAAGAMAISQLDLNQANFSRKVASAIVGRLMRTTSARPIASLGR